MKVTQSLLLASLAVTAAMTVACGKKATNGNPAIQQSNGTPGTTQVTPSGGDGSDQSFVDLLSTPGTTPGNANFTGTIRSTPFNPNAVFYDVVGDANGTPYAVYVVLASDANFCNDLVNNANEIKNSAHLVMVAETVDAAGNLAPLDSTHPFTITADGTQGNLGALKYLPFDENCQVSLADAYLLGESGSITFTALSTTAGAGTFMSTVGIQNDVISGSFTASACPGLIAENVGGVSPGCQ